MNSMHNIALSSVVQFGGGNANGGFDGAQPINGVLTGFAYDTSSRYANNSIQVFYTVDERWNGNGGAGGNVVAYVTANQPCASNATTNNCGGRSGNHRFSISVPDAVCNGAPHTVYLYAIPLSGGSIPTLDARTLSCISSNPTPTSTPTEPVIFVPGIAGSQLNTTSGENLWFGGVSTDRKKLTLDPNKPQTYIIAPDVIRDSPVTVYKPLLDAFVRGGYIEYQLGGDISRLTASGCDYDRQKANKPSLLVFPYDWRKSNDENADKLKDYVQCVEQFFPNAKINIVAHSMGGLLSRHYILKNPNDHNVKQLITIASPWLGAPKAIFTLETGKFFSNPYDSWFDINNDISVGLDRLLSSTFKDLVEFYPGVHQLLPSRAYYDLGGQPFREDGWDINGNGVNAETYSADQQASLLDSRHPRSAPGTNGFAFHSYAGQDDWRGDQTGVKYFQVFGNQSRQRTIGQVTAKASAIRIPGTSYRFRERHFFEPVATSGDGTVPLLSATRAGANGDLQGAQQFIPITAASDGEDDGADHTGLTKNPKVHDIVLTILRTGSYQSGARNEAQPKTIRSPFINASFTRNDVRATKSQSGKTRLPFLKSPLSLQASGGIAASWYVTLVGVSKVTVADAFGNANSQIDSLLQQTVPGADIYPLGADAVHVITGTNGEYTITFRSTGESVRLDIVGGINNATPTQLIRYIDLPMPAGATAMLKIMPQGVQNLAFDADGDGVFETVIAPTVAASGAAAQDLTPPTVNISLSPQQGQSLINIAATDAESGVKTVYYSLDGVNYQIYSAPFTTDCQTRIVYAFADDNVANRSSVINYAIPNRPPDVSRAQPSVSSIFPANHKMVSVSIQDVTDPDCDAVTIRIDRIMQDEPVNGTGDGDTCPDATGIGTSTAQLRAERSGNGNGRVYTIYFTATDARGLSSQGSVKVAVPKNAKDVAVDDGARFDSTVCP